MAAVEPIWCLVANVAADLHGGKIGTKHFAPGSKVYCARFDWGGGGDRVWVVGLSRGKRLITIAIATSQLCNWRAQKVYQNNVVRRLGAVVGAEPWTEALAKERAEDFKRWREHEVHAPAELRQKGIALHTALQLLDGNATGRKLESAIKLAVGTRWPSSPDGSASSMTTASRAKRLTSCTCGSVSAVPWGATC